MIAALIILALVLNGGLAALVGLFLLVSGEEAPGRGSATFMAATATLSFGLLLSILLGVSA